MESPGLAMMHADDAGARQICEADWVEIYNARGKIRLRARIDGSVPAGVVAASLNWNKLSTGGNNVNALTSERLTDLGRGPRFIPPWWKFESSARTKRKTCSLR